MGKGVVTMKGIQFNLQRFASIGTSGDDFLATHSWYSSLYGGAGNDTISIGGADVDGTTMNGGKGNDILYMDGRDGFNYIYYQTGDGADTIYGLGTYDRVILASGVYYSTMKSGSDFLINMLDGGSMTFKNVSSARISGGTYTVGGGKYFSYYNQSYKTVAGTAYNDTVYAYNLATIQFIPMTMTESQ